MSDKVVFNFFNGKDTFQALCQYFCLNEAEVLNFIKENIKNKDDENVYLNFIKRFTIPFRNFDTTKAYITVKHLTTFHDGGGSLKKFGLLNLQDALVYDTPLKDFLHKNEVAIEIDNKILVLKGERLPIFRCTEFDCLHCSFGKAKCHEYSEDYRKAIDRLHLKLYHDRCETEVFICGDFEEIKNYLTQINQRPEIILTIDNILIAMGNPLNLGEKWANLQNGYFYILEFEININSLEHLSYLWDIDNKPDDYYRLQDYYQFSGYDQSHFHSELIPKDFYTNLFLIINSINVIYSGGGQEYGQILPETKIPYDDLRIQKFRVH